MNNEIKNKIFWYSKNWYKTTGNKLEDLKIILKDNYLTEGWSHENMTHILIDNFPELFGNGNFLRKMLNNTVFEIYDFINIKDKTLNCFLKEIAYKPVDFMKSIMEIDEKYQHTYNLKEEK